MAPHSQPSRQASHLGSNPDQGKGGALDSEAECVRLRAFPRCLSLSFLHVETCILRKMPTAEIGLKPDILADATAFSGKASFEFEDQVYVYAVLSNYLLSERGYGVSGSKHVLFWICLNLPLLNTLAGVSEAFYPCAKITVSGSSFDAPTPLLKIGKIGWYGGIECLESLTLTLLKPGSPSSLSKWREFSCSHC